MSNREVDPLAPAQSDYNGNSPRSCLVILRSALSSPNQPLSVYLDYVTHYPNHYIFDRARVLLRYYFCVVKKAHKVTEGQPEASLAIPLGTIRLPYYSR